VIPVHAVVVTHNRPDDLRDCVAALAPQVHHVTVIDNASDPPVSMFDGVDVIGWDPQQPPNLSFLWNRGIDYARGAALGNRATRWDTLVVNDDFVAGPGFVPGLQGPLRGTHAVLASPYVFDGTSGHMTGRVDVYEQQGTLTNAGTRMAGFAWMIKGESGLRVDESIRWWYGDDDIAQQACGAGGRIVVHGLTWEHRHPDEGTTAHPELAEQAGRDRVTFVDKWGFQPW
jgi:glycosyltransferase involved in cell wall biosynthesis